jgi:hypothetical protein
MGTELELRTLACHRSRLARKDVMRTAKHARRRAVRWIGSEHHVLGAPVELFCGFNSANLRCAPAVSLSYRFNALSGGKFEFGVVFPAVIFIQPLPISFENFRGVLDVWNVNATLSRVDFSGVKRLNVGTSTHHDYSCS